MYVAMNKKQVVFYCMKGINIVSCLVRYGDIALPEKENLKSARMICFVP